MDLERGCVLVTGKGRKERPFGKAVKQALWESIQIRDELKSIKESGLWVSDEGKPVLSTWLYRMLRRLGDRCGVISLHTHRFCHTFAINALRAKVPEQILREMAGWEDIPPNYFKTLAAEDVAKIHREMSPADKLLGEGNAAMRRQGPEKRNPRYRL